ncbi:MAG: LysM peptidoglycan-binding domain-containing protein [Zoogloeaceae bacterium]|nr:LysM peptidoglycan-binding domain-containing protein [Zoogloeaceae bacterium]
MSRIISALFMAVATATAAVAFAAEPEPIPLATNAPDRYTVVKGDTLWGIAGRFLQNPWRWPDIWQLNKDQIKNPHWIYPGDIVFLDYVDGQPRLRLGKNVTGSGTIKLSPSAHSEHIDQAIPSIPANAIEAFISRPLVVELNELQNAPRVIGTDESRVIMGNGDEIFALGITENHPKWYVYRLGAPLKNPLPPESENLTDKEILAPVLRYMRTPTYEDEVKAAPGEAGGQPGDVLGYEVVYLGTAQLREPGNVSTLEILSAKEEILKGDLLVPAEEPTLNSYAPHKADHDVSGQVISVHGGVGVGGKFSVIALNLGERAGVEPGHVLGIYTKRDTVYEDKDTGRNKTIALPDKRNGLVFIFRVFNRVSYGLVMEAVRPTVVGDSIRNP